MKTITTLLLTAAATFAVTACSDKKPSNDIITSKQVEKAPASPVKMQDSDQKSKVEWTGKDYTVDISRKSDTALPIITDESGTKYYDNRITVKVTRPDGTLFFNKVFTKNDFADITGENYLKKTALLGIVVDSAEDGSLNLAASVGAPDVLSDDYIPMIISISRMGDVSIKKDERAEFDIDE